MVKDEQCRWLRRRQRADVRHGQIFVREMYFSTLGLASQLKRSAAPGKQVTRHRQAREVIEKGLERERK